MNQTVHYTIGLMSGTSMDGVDAVCARFADHRFDALMAHTHVSFDAVLRQELLALQDVGENELQRTRLLALALSKIYAQAVAQLRALPQMAVIDIEAIGCHGQTVRHAPQAGYSVQLADWALLAELTGLPVAGDFRAADIAAGGQGAPLVPAFHHMLFAQHDITRAIVNIGGIANLTVLAADGAVRGFDTGPGNMLMDAWMRQHFARDYDDNGSVARSGQVLPELLAELLADPYFQKAPPKSTGRDDFSLAWLMRLLDKEAAAQDVLRTLLEVTVCTVADATRAYAADAQEVLLCGGGAYNGFLRERLAALLPRIKIADTGDYGLPPTQVEAAAFAWLAHCRLHHIPANLPMVTGARGARVLGALWESV